MRTAVWRYSRRRHPSLKLAQTCRVIIGRTCRAAREPPRPASAATCATTFNRGKPNGSPPPPQDEARAPDATPPPTGLVAPNRAVLLRYGPLSLLMPPRHLRLLQQRDCPRWRHSHLSTMTLMCSCHRSSRTSRGPQLDLLRHILEAARFNASRGEAVDRRTHTIAKSLLRSVRRFPRVLHGGGAAKLRHAAHAMPVRWSVPASTVAYRRRRASAGYPRDARPQSAS